MTGTGRGNAIQYPPSPGLCYFRFSLLPEPNPVNDQNTRPIRIGSGPCEYGSNCHPYCQQSFSSAVPVVGHSIGASFSSTTVILPLRTRVHCVKKSLIIILPLSLSLSLSLSYLFKIPLGFCN